MQLAGTGTLSPPRPLTICLLALQLGDASAFISSFAHTSCCSGVGP